MTALSALAAAAFTPPPEGALPPQLDAIVRQACAGAWRAVEVVLAGDVLRGRLSKTRDAIVRDAVEGVLGLFGSAAIRPQALAALRSARDAGAFDGPLDLAGIVATVRLEGAVAAGRGAVGILRRELAEHRDLDAALGDLEIASLLIDAARAIFRHLARDPELTRWAIGPTGSPHRDRALAAFADLVGSRASLDELETLIALPIALDDNVQFTVYRPRAIDPNKWHQLLAFAHLAERRLDEQDLPDPVEEVQRQAAQVLGDKAHHYAPVVQDSGSAIPAEGELTFVPELPGIEVNPPRRSFLWLETVHREEFRIRAPSSLDGKTVRGRVTVFLGTIAIAEVALTVRVDAARPEPTRREPAVGRNYRKIFASYSHRDIAIVNQFESYARALGDEYLRDWVHLRTGEVWNDRLCQLIEQADAFQLFWSWNSMQSKFVRQEYEHALALNRPSFVRPTYWEEPMPSAPGLPPDALIRLHFQRLGGTARATGEQLEQVEEARAARKKQKARQDVDHEHAADLDVTDEHAPAPMAPQDVDAYARESASDKTDIQSIDSLAGDASKWDDMDREVAAPPSPTPRSRTRTNPGASPPIMRLPRPAEPQLQRAAASAPATSSAYSGARKEQPDTQREREPATPWSRPNVPTPTTPMQLPPEMARSQSPMSNALPELGASQPQADLPTSPAPSVANAPRPSAPRPGWSMPPGPSRPSSPSSAPPVSAIPPIPAMSADPSPRVAPPPATPSVRPTPSSRLSQPASFPPMASGNPPATMSEDTDPRVAPAPSRSPGPPPQPSPRPSQPSASPLPSSGSDDTDPRVEPAPSPPIASTLVPRSDETVSASTRPSQPSSPPAPSPSTPMAAAPEGWAPSPEPIRPSAPGPSSRPSRPSAAPIIDPTTNPGVMEPRRPAPPLAQSKTVMSPGKLPASDQPASWPESVWSRPTLEESNVGSAGIDISLDESSESSAVPAREAGFSWPDNPAEPPAPISWSDELIAGPDAASRIVAELPKSTDKRKRSASEPNPEVARPSKMVGYQSTPKIPNTLTGSPPPASPVVAKDSTLPPVSPYAPTVPQQVYRPEPYDPRPKSVGDAARPKFPDAPSSGNGAKIVIVVLVLLVLAAAAIVYFFVRR